MRVVFENATIADAVQKASRVAPTKGSAFDKAAGIVMTLNEADTTVTIKATNLEVYYTEIVSAVSVEGEGSWRFPSSILSGVLGKLPIGTNKNVSLTGDTREALMKSGRTTAKLRCIGMSDYPIWSAFDPNQLDMVADLGARIGQVEWAADPDINSPVAGIYLDGKTLVATDRIRMVTVPCEAAPIYKPITVPAGILKPVMRTMRDCAIGIDGGQFLIMPDDSTQIRTVIYGAAYPDVSRALVRNHPESFKFKKAELLDIIDRAMVFGGNDRSPSLKVIIGRSEVAVMMTDADQGFLGDVIDVNGADHPRVTMMFTPKNLVEALNAAPSEHCELHYNTEDKKLITSVRLDGGSGYEAWVMPRRNLEVG